jgi:superfamily II DNA or RNA helicase
VGALPGTPKEIATEFGFRDPQRRALMKLHATLGAIDLKDPLDDITASLPGATRFDSEFPSFCFDMATGVGKTKLLAGSIVYLARNGYSRNFFVIAPGETIYAKLIRELTPSDPGYLFKGIGGMDDLRVVTGEDYLYREPLTYTDDPLTIYVFNIQKLLAGTTRQRYKFHTFQETLGGTFADTVRDKGDLVVLMDESHRYRGPEYFAAINALKPMLGLEYTATPIFQGNVIYDYPLKQAVADGWIKKLRPIYRQNDAALEEELDELKLRDGLLVHEQTKLELETYADAMGLPRIRPMVLLNLPLIDRAKAIATRLESDEFGYGGRVLVIHSQSDDEEEQLLVDLEKESSSVEVVVHVNRLREGWDVRNIFTIVPLRASISDTLTAQTIGRGVRLPFGANNREELANPEVATLSVICYQTGRDNYARILESAEQLGIEEGDAEDAGKIKKTERITVKVLDKPSKIVVPEVEAQIDSSASFAPFDPQVKISDETAAAKLVGVDLVANETEEIGAATVTALADPVAHLAQTLLDRVAELTVMDAPTVAKIVKQYLNKATDSDEKKDWEDYLGAKRRFARDDLLLQIKENVQKKAEVTYTVTERLIAFDSYDTVLPVGSAVKSWKSVPNSEIRQSLVGGYEKTIYEGFRFDSQQEKWLGDAMEKDDNVLEWLKVPEGKLVIRTPAGRYLPDEIAVTEDVTYLLEVKRAKEIEENNPGVVEKAKRAAEWCKAVTEETGREWRYRLLRHDRIKEGDTLEGMLNGAVSLDDFIGAKAEAAA